MSEVGQEDSAPAAPEERIVEQDADMIELDGIDGEIEDLLSGEDDLGERGSQAVVHEEILLSSDEEQDTTEDVSLVLLRRPPAIQPQEAIDILDSDEEFPVYITEASKPDNVNILEKKGRVAEYIESEGLGVIYAE